MLSHSNKKDGKSSTINVSEMVSCLWPANLTPSYPVQSLFVKRIPDLAANDLRFEYSLTQQENNPDGVFDPGEISRGQHIIWETNK